MTLEGDEVRIAVAAASRRTGACVGRVIAHGPGGAHLSGVRVVAGAQQACGECDVCRRGGAPVCPLGRTIEIAAEVVARARWVLPLDGLLAIEGPHAALIAGEAGLAYAMYARAGVAPREPTAVLGDDPIARLLAQILAAKNAAPAPIGPRPTKIFATDLAAATAALAAAPPRSVVTVAMLDPGGLDVAAALAREVTVLGVHAAHADLLPEVAALAVRGDLDLAAAGAELMTFQ